MSTFIEKQRHILDFALASLLRRKGKNLALIAVYALVVFGLGSVMFFTQALKEEAAIILLKTPEIIVQKMSAGRHDLIPLSYADKIAKIRGVEAVKPRLWGYYYDPGVGANYTVMVPQDYPLTGNSIAVGEGISRVRQVPKGSYLTYIRAYDGRYLHFLVSAVIRQESALLTSDLILVSAGNFRRIFGTPESYATDLTVQVLNKKEIPTIAAKIMEILPDSRPILRDEILRTYDAVFDWRGGILIAVLLGAAMAFFIFAWDKAAGLSAKEKREIGILKAIGWETADVIQLKFWEGLAVSLSSFLLGVILAYLHVFFGSASLFGPVIKGWSVLYPDFRLSPSFSLYQISILFFLTVVPYTVVTIVPSWGAATIDPDQVMRT